MRFKDISVKGFEGIGFESGVELTGLQHRNILIGPNNVGKSTLFRAMHFLQMKLQNLNNGNRDYRDLFMNTIAPDNIWCKEKTDNDIYFSISLERAPGFLVHNQMTLSHFGELSFEVYVRSARGDKPTVLVISPRVFVTGSNTAQPLLQKTGDAFHCYDPRNGYIPSYESMNLMSADVVATLSSFFANQKYFDSVRQILKPGSVAGEFVDGTSLLPTLHSMQEDSAQGRRYQTLRTRLLGTVNELLVSSGTRGFDNFEIKKQGSAPPDLCFYQGDEIISATKMGTGISELFFICASLLLDDGKEVVYYLEEPETHMHPGLLRRMYRMFAKHQNIQFMINTHSNILLDDIADEDRIYLWSRNMVNHESSARPCHELVDHHQVLDDLGIRASSLLQCNCVLWLEGPSDRIYVKHWLEEIGKEKGELLIDGSDYSVVLYGGGLLAHYECDNTEDDRFISMVKMSRFAVILMDKDFGDDESDPSLKPRVRHILEGIASDKSRRLSLITNGREIENDINRSVFLSGVKEVLASLKPKENKFANISMPGSNNYYHEIAEHLFSGQEKLIALAANRLSKKVSLAEAVIACCDNSTRSYPDYALQIYEHVKKSRLGD